MTQNQFNSAAAIPVASLENEDFYTGSFTELPESTAEPKGKILSWHWEPVRETYVMPKKIMGAA